MKCVSDVWAISPDARFARTHSVRWMQLTFPVSSQYAQQHVRDDETHGKKGGDVERRLG